MCMSSCRKSQVNDDKPTGPTAEELAAAEEKARLDAEMEALLGGTPAAGGGNKKKKKKKKKKSGSAAQAPAPAPAPAPAADSTGAKPAGKKDIKVRSKPPNHRPRTNRLRQTMTQHIFLHRPSSPPRPRVRRRNPQRRPQPLLPLEEKQPKRRKARRKARTNLNTTKPQHGRPRLNALMTKTDNHSNVILFSCSLVLPLSGVCFHANAAASLERQFRECWCSVSTVSSDHAPCP